jgi:hypothetical protein
MLFYIVTLRMSQTNALISCKLTSCKWIRSSGATYQLPFDCADLAIVISVTVL